MDPEKLEYEENRLQSSGRLSSLSDSSPGDRDGNPTTGISRVWYKIDWRILPVTIVLNILCAIDRNNIGNARVAGLQKDLKITDKQFTIALMLTNVAILIAQLPASLLHRIIGPNILIPGTVTIWGITTAAQGVVTNYSGLLACRFFLGFMEGGFLPSAVLYLSDFYPRSMLQKRISAFSAPAVLSGAISGLAAYGIIRMDGVGSHKAWQWIFILEGVVTIVCGILSFFLLPRSLDRCKFLNDAERKWTAQIIEQTGQEDVTSFSWREVKTALLSLHVWIVSINGVFWGVALGAIAVFVPSIIFGMGYSGLDANRMSAPPFAVAFVVTIATAVISDRFQSRGFVLVACGTMAIAGFSMFLGSNSLQVQYGSLFLAVSGASSVGPTLATWQSNNSSPHVRRATAVALAYVTTNFGQILSMWLYGGVLSPAPRYTLATRVLVAFCVIGTLLAVVNWAWLRWLNQKKVEKRRAVTKEQEEKGLGDKSAWFLYTM